MFHLYLVLLRQSQSYILSKLLKDLKELSYFYDKPSQLKETSKRQTLVKLKKFGWLSQAKLF